MYHGQIVSWRQTYIMDGLCHRDRLILWTDCVTETDLWRDCVTETDLYHGQIVSCRQTCIMDSLCDGDRLLLKRDRLVLKSRDISSHLPG